MPYPASVVALSALFPRTSFDKSVQSITSQSQWSAGAAYILLIADILIQLSSVNTFGVSAYAPLSVRACISVPPKSQSLMVIFAPTLIGKPKSLLSALS